MSSKNNPKSQPIAFVYQESDSSPANYKVYWNQNKEGSEDINDLARSIALFRDKIRFLTEDEINNMFGMEAIFIRPFNDNERRLLLS